MITFFTLNFWQTNGACIGVPVGSAASDCFVPFQIVAIEVILLSFSTLQSF